MLNFKTFLKFIVPIHIITLGILGIDLGFSKKKESSTGSVNEDVSKSETESQKQTSSKKSTSEQTALSSTLDAGTQQLVQDLISNIGSDVAQQDNQFLTDIAGLIAERAAGAQDSVEQSIAPIISDARLQGEQKLQQLQTQLAQQSGGSLANTLVASSTALGAANLESQLARAEGELMLQGREAVTQELQSAISGVGTANEAPVNNLVNLLNILKGSTVSQTQTGVQQVDVAAELSRILDSISNRTSQSSASGASSAIDFKLTGQN